MKNKQLKISPFSVCTLSSPLSGTDGLPLLFIIPYCNILGYFISINNTISLVSYQFM